MMRTAIIDDEIGNVTFLEEVIRDYAPQCTVVGRADSVASGLRLIGQERPELLFLDVQLGDGTGFDLLRQCGQQALKVIFITAHQQFAIDAFRCAALDYLLKPVSPPQLLEAIGKAAQAVDKEELLLKMEVLLANIRDTSLQKRKILIKTLDCVYTIGTGEIVRLQSDGNYTTVYLEDGKKIVTSRLLKEFETLLTPSRFLRVHQSHLVNLDFAFYFKKPDCTLVMKDQSVIPVSSRRKEQVLLAI